MILLRHLLTGSLKSKVMGTNMVTTLNRPSSLIHEIQLEKVDNLNLFKFSESLQLRMESLLEKKKADQMTSDEMAELDAIGELDRIFTHINAMLAAQNANQ